MSATIDSQPATPASAYRPLVFKALRADPSGSEVIHIYVADSTLASTLGIEVGQVVVKHATIIGDVPAVAGQTVRLYQNCGAYGDYVTQYGKGIYMILDEISSGGSLWMVIDAPDLGDYTPSGSPTAALKIWLNNYTFYLRVLVYTDPAADPTEIDLQGTPDTTGATYFDVSKVVQNYFNADISRYALPIGAGSLVQDAYATTALWYQVIVAEVYDSPGADAVFDPFDLAHHPGSDVFFTDTDYRVAVNAIHPSTYTDEVISGSTPTTLDWSTAGLGAYVMGQGAASFERKFLTHAPRMLNMASTDHFRLHMLTWSVPPVGIDPYTMPSQMRLRFYDAATNTLILDKQIDLSQATPAFSVGVGPADLGAFIALPAAYKVYVSATNDNILSEYFQITVVSGCTEQSTPVVALNPLGGIDSYSFTGRKWNYGKDGFGTFTVSTKPITNSVRKWLVNLLFKRGKTQTVSKYYSPGTGYDWTERAYRGPIAVTRLSPTIVAPLIVDGPDGPVAEVSTSYTRELTMDYHLGVDQISQQG